MERNMLIREVTDSDGNKSRMKQLCTSPTHFRNILVGELLDYSGRAPARFIYENMPLHSVGRALQARGF